MSENKNIIIPFLKYLNEKINSIIEMVINKIVDIKGTELMVKVYQVKVNIVAIIVYLLGNNAINDINKSRASMVSFGSFARRPDQINKLPIILVFIIIYAVLMRVGSKRIKEKNPKD